MPPPDISWISNELRALAQELGIPSESQEPLLLALDQGGHASRALVFDLTGRQIAQAFSPISTFRKNGDRVEHDPVELLESMRAVIADIAQSLGNDVNRIVAAGMATQRSSIVCWNALNGTPLSPVLSWQDRRNAAALEPLQAHAADIQRHTGLVLSPHYGASKMRWCLDELDTVRRARERRQLMMGPLASFLLRGLLAAQPQKVDPCNASRTLLWDPSSRDWSPRLLQLFGIPREVLPACVPNRHAFGHLQVGDREVPVTVCTGDQAAVPFGNGALDPDALHLNIGTGAFMLCTTDTEVADAAPLLRSVLWWDEGQLRFALEGTVNGAGSALDWLNERIGIDAHRAARVLTRALTAELEIPIFLNGVSGVGSPYWLPRLESRFIGNDAGNETGQVAAVLESIAFLTTDNVALLRRHRPGLKRIAAGGGLAASNYLCECIADLTGLMLDRSARQELTARGLAFLIAGQPPGWTDDAAIHSFPPARHPGLHERYLRWQAQMRDASSPVTSKETS